MAHRHIHSSCVNKQFEMHHWKVYPRRSILCWVPELISAQWVTAPAVRLCNHQTHHHYVNSMKLPTAVWAASPSRVVLETHDSHPPQYSLMKLDIIMWLSQHQTYSAMRMELSRPANYKTKTSSDRMRSDLLVPIAFNDPVERWSNPF